MSAFVAPKTGSPTFSETLNALGMDWKRKKSTSCEWIIEQWMVTLQSDLLTRDRTISYKAFDLVDEQTVHTLSLQKKKTVLKAVKCFCLVKMGRINCLAVVHPLLNHISKHCKIVQTRSPLHEALWNVLRSPGKWETCLVHFWPQPRPLKERRFGGEAPFPLWK